MIREWDKSWSEYGFSLSTDPPIFMSDSDIYAKVPTDLLIAPWGEDPKALHNRTQSKIPSTLKNIKWRSCIELTPKSIQEVSMKRCLLNQTTNQKFPSSQSKALEHFNLEIKYDKKHGFIYPKEFTNIQRFGSDPLLTKKKLRTLFGKERCDVRRKSFDEKISMLTSVIHKHEQCNKIHKKIYHIFENKLADMKSTAEATVDFFKSYPLMSVDYEDWTYPVNESENKEEDSDDNWTEHQIVSMLTTNASLLSSTDQAKKIQSQYFFTPQQLLEVGALVTLRQRRIAMKSNDKSIHGSSTPGTNV